jgi:hypothetical protein
MLSNFTLSHVRFTLLARDRIRIPRMNKGITLRGGFGTAFRSLVCVDRQATCDSCRIAGACPYALIFSPTVPPEAERLRLNRDIPRPFVIKPRIGAQELYEAGETFPVDLILVGKARDFFPYFFLCFQRLGEMGMGSGRGRFTVGRVEFLNAAGKAFTAFKAGDDLLDISPVAITFGELAETSGASAATAAIRLEFLTPVLLKAGGAWTVPNFGPLMRRLRDRIHALSYFHCGQSLDMDFASFGEEADRIESLPERLEWIEEKRCSRRGGDPYPVQGYRGSMVYKGDLRTFLPFLSLGEYVHVGKAATFGQGWYTVREYPEVKGECDGDVRQGQSSSNP